MECKCILLPKRPSCWFMHSLCKNENIPMWGKHRCRITKEIAIHLYRLLNHVRGTDKTIHNQPDTMFLHLIRAKYHHITLSR